MRPRGSFVVPDDFDWYLFIGDETALPAIGRRLEELRPGAKAIVVAAVAGPEEEQTFDSRANVTTIWVRRPLSRAEDPAPLLAAGVPVQLPESNANPLPQEPKAVTVTLTATDAAINFCSVGRSTSSSRVM